MSGHIPRASYKIITRCAVRGWCDSSQRVFEPDGSNHRRNVVRFANSLGLRKSQFKIVKERT